MDDPLTIVTGAIDNHVRMINEYKGVPGVQPARLQEGFQVCFIPAAVKPSSGRQGTAETLFAIVCAVEANRPEKTRTCASGVALQLRPCLDGT